MKKQQGNSIMPHENGMIFLPHFTDIYITYQGKRVRIENCEEFFKTPYVFVFFPI